MLSGREMLSFIDSGRLGLDPFDASNVGPNSIDLRLGNFPLLRHRIRNGVPLDTHAPSEMYGVPVGANGAFLLLGGVLYLGATLERVTLNGLCGFVCGRSTMARWGVETENAGFIDNGWSGNLTVELLSPHDILVYPGDRICQLVLDLTEDSDFDYSKCGHYRDSRGPVAPVSLAGRGHGAGRS